MSHKYIIFPSVDTIYENRINAVNSTLEILNENKDNYLDGENIRVRYLSDDGEVIDTNCIVYKNDNGIELSMQISDKDSLRIVDSENEPVDKDCLWLTDVENGDEFSDTSDLLAEIDSLKRELNLMKSMMAKHEYALTNSLSGGDFIMNSVKYRLENLDTPDKPENAEDKVIYASNDFTVVDFVVYIGNTPITTFLGNIDFLTEKRYYFKVKYINKLGEIIKDSGYTIDDIIVSSDNPILETNKNFFASSEEGISNITFKVGDFTNSYSIQFVANLKPDYNIYGEPTTPHLLVKSAPSKDILFANSDYLCVNEFVWCKSANTLYFKAESSKGNLTLFPINTGERVNDYPDTPSDTTVDVSGETLYINGQYATVNGSTLNLTGNNIYVDAYGVLHIDRNTTETDGIGDIKDDLISTETI